MESEILLRLENISKTFPGTKALKNVNLSIKKGEIHALMGENGAGKSTISNIIGGVYHPDPGGKIFLDGNEIVFNNVMDAQNAGVAFVHQETALIPSLSVADNIYVGRTPSFAKFFVNQKKMQNDAKTILEKIGADISPADQVKYLNPANTQLVEIAKALSINCRLLILDEPTSSISIEESQKLFVILNDLKKQGVSILYISHRINEIFELCDRISVLRDGEIISTVDVKKTTADDVVKMMVGREMTSYYPPKAENISDEVIFKCENLSFDPDYKDINFELHKGEILGFSGLVGAGRSEMMEAILGIRKRNSGKFWLNGKEVENKDFEKSIKNGFGFVNEDRKESGLFLPLTMVRNISAADLDTVSDGLFVNKNKEIKQAEDYIKKLKIKVWGTEQICGTLSGGNQQKVMVAKWLATQPRVIIMDEPTKGIDVGTKKEIHDLLRSLANQGIGVIVISSELPEIIGVCDRVIIVYEHRIVNEVTGKDINENEIMQFASGNTVLNI